MQFAWRIRYRYARIINANSSGHNDNYIAARKTRMNKNSLRKIRLVLRFRASKTTNVCNLQLTNRHVCSWQWNVSAISRTFIQAYTHTFVRTCLLALMERSHGALLLPVNLRFLCSLYIDSLMSTTRLIEACLVDDVDARHRQRPSSRRIESSFIKCFVLAAHCA